MDDLEKARALVFGAGVPVDAAPQDDLAKARAIVFGGPTEPDKPSAVGPNRLDNIMPAIGMGMTDMGLGLKQRAYEFMANEQNKLAGAGGKISAALGIPDFNEKLKSLQQEIIAKRATDKELANAPGGTIGSIIGRAALATPLSFAPGGATLGGAMLTGGLSSAMEPTVGDESVTKNAALGMAGGGVGYGVGKLIGKVISPAIKPADKSVETLLQNGVPVRLDQASNSNVVKNVAAAMDNLPFTAGVRQAQKTAQNEGLNRAVARTMGSDANKLTDEAMGAIRDQLGQKFTDLSARNTLTDTPTLLQGLINIQNQSIPKLPDNIKGAVQAHINDIVSKIDPATGTIPGGVYRMLDTQLGKTLRKGGDLGHAVGEVRDALRSAMDNSISAADSAAWKEVRKQYANMMAAANSRNAAGDILPRTLYTQTAKGNSSVKFGGGTDLADIARAARQVVPDPIPNSGTAQRALYQNLLGYGSLGGAGAGYGAATGRDPMDTAAMALGIGLGGNLGARVLGSNVGGAYMSNALTPELLKRLLAQSGGLLGGTAARPYPN